MEVYLYQSKIWELVKEIRKMNFAYLIILTFGKGELSTTIFILSQNSQDESCGT
jgi:hypothetical protein